MTKVGTAIIICVPLILLGCSSVRTATETRAVLERIEHDTIVQVREVLHVDSVEVYRGHSVEYHLDTILIRDTIREVRWRIVNTSDTAARMFHVEHSDSLTTKTETETVKPPESRWSGWQIFTTIWFVLTILAILLLIIWKIWKFMKK